MALPAVLEQDVPVGARARDAEQHLARLVGAEDEHDLEVVPRPAAQVDHDRAVAQGTRDRAGDGVEHGLEVGAGPRGARDVQQATQLIDTGLGHSLRIGRFGGKSESNGQSATRTAQRSAKKRRSTVVRR